MEIKYKVALYFGLAVSILMLLSLLIRSGSKAKYGGGKKTLGIQYSKDESYFKVKMFQYKLLYVAITFLFIATIMTACFLLSRPYKNKITTTEIYNRDIMLCLDISSSVDEVNMELVDKLKDTVENLQGDRVGIIIFNTSPVLISPLTDDYDYIIEQLDRLKECLSSRINNMEGMDFYESNAVYDYLTEGTLIDAEEVGSSLIGDGLASSVMNFNDLDSDRTRIVIFSTDNDLYGEQTFTLQEAADLCSSKKIKVFGIGTNIMRDVDKESMEKAVLSTGGKMYIAEENSFKDIVEDIEKTSKSVMKSEVKSQELMIVKWPFLLVLTSVFTLMLFMRISKR